MIRLVREPDRTTAVKGCAMHNLSRPSRRGVASAHRFPPVSGADRSCRTDRAVHAPPAPPSSPADPARRIRSVCSGPRARIGLGRIHQRLGVASLPMLEQRFQQVGPVFDEPVKTRPRTSEFLCQHQQLGVFQTLRNQCVQGGPAPVVPRAPTRSLAPTLIPVVDPNNQPPRAANRRYGHQRPETLPRINPCPLTRLPGCHPPPEAG